MSPPERMRTKLGDLASTITQSQFGESAPMPLEAMSVDDHLVAAAQEAMTDLKSISETLLHSGDRENAVRLQSARMTMKTVCELYVSLRDKDALERRHHDRHQ